jgi:hypothetical protein
MNNYVVIQEYLTVIKHYATLLSNDLAIKIIICKLKLNIKTEFSPEC